MVSLLSNYGFYSLILYKLVIISAIIGLMAKMRGKLSIIVGLFVVAMGILVTYSNFLVLTH